MISWFRGIAVRMFFNDHNPPHFHVYYGRHDAKVDLETGQVVRGELPAVQRRLVRAWTMRYKSELMAAWEAVRADRAPERIPGLDGDDD